MKVEYIGYLNEFIATYCALISVCLVFLIFLGGYVISDILNYIL